MPLPAVALFAGCRASLPALEADAELGLRPRQLELKLPKSSLGNNNALRRAW